MDASVLNHDGRAERAVAEKRQLIHHVRFWRLRLLRCAQDRVHVLLIHARVKLIEINFRWATLFGRCPSALLFHN